MVESIVGIVEGIACVPGMADGIADIPGMADGIADIPGMADGIADIPGMADGIADIPGMADGIADIPGMADGIADIPGMADGIADISGIADGIADMPDAIAGWKPGARPGYQTVATARTRHTTPTMRENASPFDHSFSMRTTVARTDHRHDAHGPEREEDHHQAPAAAQAVGAVMDADAEVPQSTLVRGVVEEQGER